MFAAGLLTAMQLAFWGALALVLLWAYRHLRLPSVPWLAAPSAWRCHQLVAVAGNSDD